MTQLFRVGELFKTAQQLVLFHVVYHIERRYRTLEIVLLTAHLDAGEGIQLVMERRHFLQKIALHLRICENKLVQSLTRDVLVYDTPFAVDPLDAQQCGDPLKACLLDACVSQSLVHNDAFRLVGVLEHLYTFSVRLVHLNLFAVGNKIFKFHTVSPKQSEKRRRETGRVLSVGTVSENPLSIRACQDDILSFRKLSPKVTSKKIITHLREKVKGVNRKKERSENPRPVPQPLI